MEHRKNYIERMKKLRLFALDQKTLQKIQKSPKLKEDYMNKPEEEKPVIFLWHDESVFHANDVPRKRWQGILMEFCYSFDESSLFFSIQVLVVVFSNRPTRVKASMFPCL